MANITVTVTDEQATVIDADALDAGLSRSGYVAQIVLQRKEKQVTVVGEDSKMISRMEGKMEAQSEQITNLQERLSQAGEKAGMAGVETGQKTSKKYIEEQIAIERGKWQADLDTKELAELRTLKKENEVKIKELEDHKTDNTNWKDTVNGIKEVVATPGVLQGILGSIGFRGMGGDMPGLSGVVSEDEKRALTIGKAVINDLDPLIQPDVIIILNHLVHSPKDLPAIFRLKPFADARKRIVAENDQENAAR